jgi:hypothetical protein
VAVTRTIASRGCRIAGSATSSTRTSPVPYQQTAFIRSRQCKVSASRKQLRVCSKRRAIRPSACNSSFHVQRNICRRDRWLVGTWAMSEAQRGWTRAVDGDLPESAAGKHDARDWQERHEHQNANELAAQALARYLIGRNLTREELPVAAALMHYGFGAAMGALYDAYSERRRSSGPARDWGSPCGLWPTKLRCRSSVFRTPSLAARLKCICSR